MAVQRRPKTIVVFSDGTGNSSAKLAKTNVWRLYQALDLTALSSEQIAHAQVQQIALYDNGVGTSSFKPLALLGGVFGYGLKRNIIELYKFLCRNYEPGDRIYAFGFSRGAFTIRALVGMVASVGLVPYKDDEHLSVHANRAYREFRGLFKKSNLAGAYRGLRDTLIQKYERWQGSAASPERIVVKHVKFVGVWDTVAAYGTPVAELTRAFDRWIWPMSMPDYKLSPKVEQARHALALDDERDSFHPLLWDEIAELKIVAKSNGWVAPGRIKQIWFAGVHADVGGGYPDSSLSLVSLDWMMDEAAACGLRFTALAREQVRQDKRECGPIHDSRAGIAAYYRYQPRKLSARFEPPDPSTVLMQDPTREEAHGRLREVNIHHSVISRIRNSTDGYAPITLPPSFNVWHPDGNETQHTNPNGVDRVWNHVWRRRVMYFACLALTALLILMPAIFEPGCEGVQCVFSPLVTTVGSLLPGFMQVWIKTWAGNPLTFLLLIAAIVTAMATSVRLQRSIADLMRGIWGRVLNSDPGPEEKLEGVDAAILRLRTSSFYQLAVQKLKWRYAPGVLAGLIALGGVSSLPLLLHRTPFALVDAHAKHCKPAQAGVVAIGLADTPVSGTFNTNNPCWDTGLAVSEQVRYRLTIRADTVWQDGELDPTSPVGFTSSKFGWFAPLAVAASPLKRSAGNWFEPVIVVRDKRGYWFTQAVSVQALPTQSEEKNSQRYSGTFTAPASGPVYLFVNDVLLPWWGDGPPPFYHNNHGTASVSLEHLQFEHDRN